MREHWRKLLTDDEYKEALYLGMQLKLAEVLPQEKQAQHGVGNIAGELVKTVGAVSIILGVPTGVVWHMLDRDVKARGTREQQYEGQLRHYRQAGKQLEQELANEQAVIG